LGKDIEHLKARVGVLESRKEKCKKKCGRAHRTRPMDVRLGTEEVRTGDRKELRSYQSKFAHWDRDDAGDCESTYVDLTIYDDGRYVIYQRTHDNGTAFGDHFTLAIELYKNNGIKIETLYILMDNVLDADETDENPRRGDSRAIKEEFNDIDISASVRHLACS
jgi:hypothetical protein